MVHLWHWPPFCKMEVRSKSYNHCSLYSTSALLDTASQRCRLTSRRSEVVFESDICTLDTGLALGQYRHNTCVKRLCHHTDTTRLYRGHWPGFVIIQTNVYKGSVTTQTQQIFKQGTSPALLQHRHNTFVLRPLIRLCHYTDTCMCRNPVTTHTHTHTHICTEVLLQHGYKHVWREGTCSFVSQRRHTTLVTRLCHNTNTVTHLYRCSATSVPDTTLLYRRSVTTQTHTFLQILHIYTTHLYRYSFTPGTDVTHLYSCSVTT